MSVQLPLVRLCEYAGLDRELVPAVGSSVLVTGIAHDSRLVRPGELFVAVPGERFDGAAFVDEALNRGASAVVAEQAPPEGTEVPWIQVEDSRVALSRLAAALHGQPSHELMVVGVTGTNGKTTTTYLIEAMLEEAGVPCGRIGSVSYRVGAEEQPAPRTTPEATELHALLRTLAAEGGQACALEVSSHALSLHRTDDIRFAAAVFTNLTRDHLDFHGDMRRYFATKRRLFEGLAETAPSVINVDDDHGRELVSAVARPVTYALDAQADVRPEHVELSVDGITLDTCTPRGRLQIRSRLLGRPNAYNLLAAATVGAALSLPFRAIEHGLAAVARIPGRMEVVSGEADGVVVLVDFAHTDDALKGLLTTVRSLTGGRVITVFGCGGDRDRTKRPLMGTVAARLSDRVVVTSDNPRTEDPEAIVRDVAAGLSGGRAEWTTVLDREEAIARAIRDAAPGDLVVIAGKGHERTQVIGSHVVPFEDDVVARRALATRRTRSRVG